MMINEELKMKIDKKVNKKNIKLFKKFGVNNDEDDIYTCICCGKKTCADDSCSVEGAYLVCIGCIFDKFNGSWHNCMKWQDEMIKKEKKNDK